MGRFRIWGFTALVVAIGLAGTIAIDMSKDPLGTGNDGQPVQIAGDYYVDGALNKTLHASVALDEGIDLLLRLPNAAHPRRAAELPARREPHAGRHAGVELRRLLPRAQIGRAHV